MAKAQFHRHQKVWVESVGAWANIERILPVWAKGFDEPIRITYEVGLGREFKAEELCADSPSEAPAPDGGAWRILRARNKWQAPEDCGHHPLPGTFPVVVTDSSDWGGWRVPGAEYDRDPQKIEQQARVLACAPRLMRLAHEMTALAAESPEDCTPAMIELARAGQAMLRFVADDRSAPPQTVAMAAE